MAVTVTKVATNVSGRFRERIVDVLMDSSYATGGEALTAADLGLKQPLFVQAIQKTVGTTIRVFQYDLANSKILAFQQTDPAAVGGADVPLKEVASTTDLSAITVRVRALGY
jgi:hypothetical protein